MKEQKVTKIEEELILGVLIIIFILGLFLSHFINWNQIQTYSVDFYNKFIFYFINFFAKFIIFSFFFSCAMFILMIIYFRKFQEIRKQVMSTILPADGLEEKNLGEKIINPKWQSILKDVDSDDPNKWKLAIIEADIILGELLNTLFLPGENIGDKLKAVEKSDFEHLDQAWEAHKIRNAIAHGGSDFLLTQKETKRVIGLYKSVFTEFEII